MAACSWQNRTPGCGGFLPLNSAGRYSPESWTKLVNCSADRPTLVLSQPSLCGSLLWFTFDLSKDFVQRSEETELEPEKELRRTEQHLNLRKTEENWTEPVNMWSTWMRAWVISLCCMSCVWILLTRIAFEYDLSGWIWCELCLVDYVTVGLDLYKQSCWSAWIWGQGVAMCWI